MKKIILMLILMFICTGCSLNTIEDTNGADNYELNVITDYDLVKGYNTSSLGSVHSNIGNTYKIKIKKFSGVEVFYDDTLKTGEKINISITNNVNEGNFIVFILFDNQLINKFEANSTEDYEFTAPNSGNIEIGYAGESANFNMKLVIN